MGRCTVAQSVVQAETAAWCTGTDYDSGKHATGKITPNDNRKDAPLKLSVLC